MYEMTSIRPYRTGDAPALDAFLPHATYFLGDGNFELGQMHAVYLMVGGKGDIHGLVEGEVHTLLTLDGPVGALVLTKLALAKEIDDEEYARSLVSYLAREARKLNAIGVFLPEGEIPFERELGFIPAATKGIYREENPEANIPSLRVKLVEDSRPCPCGFLR